MTRTESDRKRTMGNATTITDLTRTAAAELVAHEQRRSGSRMSAYHDVASMIGSSPSWVRKFVGRNPDVRPDLIIGLNILRRFYNELCTRVETERNVERARIAALREQIDAAFPGAMGMVVRTAGTSAAGAMAADAQAREEVSDEQSRPLLER